MATGFPENKLYFCDAVVAQKTDPERTVLQEVSKLQLGIPLRA